MNPGDEIDAILDDPSKTINGDIEWLPDPNHPSAWTFRAPVVHSGEAPLAAHGTLQHEQDRLSYLLVLRAAGRIFGICWGYGHLNPSGETVSGPHVHRWTSEHRDRWVEPFDDAGTGASDPTFAWQQFCTHANIVHRGTLHQPFDGRRGI